jgi:4-diphosphocytidyl-2-C-methyl-D-erythritol kinase
MDKEITFPYAKINIGLQITDRLPNGYHQLQSLFYPVDWCDALEVIPRGEPGTCQLVTTGIDVGGDPAQNLVSRAYARMLERFPDLPGVEAHLEKRIPFGAGLGGGSSDGAQMLLILRKIFNLPLSDNELETMASTMGADCPFFCRYGAQYLEGVGAELTPHPLSLKGYYILLVKPAVAVSTREAYSRVTPRHPETPLYQLLEEPIETWHDTVVNDFEASVFPLHPELQEIKDKIYQCGALYASMSGSGSTLFGIFAHHPGDLRSEFPADSELMVCQARV